MDTYEIEQLLSEAIENRPKVTNAPMNLYIHKNKIICGARAVMPRDAAFISHLAPEQIENGFNAKQWVAIVKEAREIAATAKLTSQMRKYSVLIEQGNVDQRQVDHKRAVERRAEERLLHRSVMRFAGAREGFLGGTMRDVSSGGMAFTCSTGKGQLRQDQEIVTQFSVPRFNRDNSFDTISFERKGRIRRIEKIDNSICRVAMQFAKPLNFKPAERRYTECDAKLEKSAYELATVLNN